MLPAALASTLRRRPTWPQAVRIEMAPMDPDPSRLQPISIVAPIHVFAEPGDSLWGLLGATGRSLTVAARIVAVRERARHARQRHHGNGPPRRGSALLMVLWISAALAAVAFSLANTVRGETDRTSTEIDEVRGYYLATGAVDRAAVELLWSVTLEGERKIKQGAAWVDYTFPTGVAHVELIPETAKLDVNFVPPDRLMRLVMALGVEPGPGVGDHARHRRPEDSRGGPGVAQAVRFPWRRVRLFRRPGASFQEIEELLSVRGITPELFYGTYVPAQGEPGPDQPRLIRRSGLVECLSVFGSKGQVDANTADPAVLTALGMTPDAVQLLLRLRREAPLTPERLAQLAPMLGPAAQFAAAGGQLHHHHARHGACAAGQRAAFGHEADRGGAGQIHAFSGYTPPSTSCAGTTRRGATSQAMPLDFAHCQRLPEVARLRLRRGPGNRRHGSRSRGHAGTPQQDPGAGPSYHRRLRHASGGRVGCGVRALPEGVGGGTPQRHGPAAAAGSDRAPDRAARCGREGYRGRHPLPTGHAPPLRGGRCRVGLVAAGVRRRAGGHRAAQHDRTLRRPFRRGRRRGAQLHVFGGGGSRRHTAQWRWDCRARDSWR